MSTSAQLPSPDQAYNTLFQNVFADTFFQKLASYGHAPRNQKEAEQFLDLAGKLEVLEKDPAITKAASDNSLIGQACGQLDQYLARQGLDGGIKRAAAADRDASISQYAARLMQSPELYNAVLSLKAAQATDIANQLT